jgi:hypothetical protein
MIFGDIVTSPSPREKRDCRARRGFKARAHQDQAACCFARPVRPPLISGEASSMAQAILNRS